jgi:hypothetical protein
VLWLYAVTVKQRGKEAEKIGEIILDSLSVLQRARDKKEK